MTKLSTHQVAKALGIDAATLSRYIKTGKIVAPPETMAGGIKLRLWSESDIERLKKLLSKIANGRKTRYQKLREKQQAPASVPAPHKKRQTKKKQK
jgi:predicted DNA-binding transcriptional regulator AlpA